MKVPLLVVAGNHNGVGKTSLSVGIVAALRRRGLVVQPFKIGPEVGDALHLTVAADRDCAIIDGWVLQDQDRVLSSVSRHCSGCDIAVIEGHHDLFDGYDGTSDHGSTSQIAKWLGAPVVLVFNFWTLTASAAVKGFLQYDPALQLSGILLNNVVEEPQVAALRSTFYRSGVGLELVGCVPKAQPGSAVTLPSAAEAGAHLSGGMDPPEYVDALADFVDRYVDMDRLLQIAETSRFAPRAGPRQTLARGRVRVAVSRDAAFCLPPAENIRLLQEFGADVVYFSPISGRLPPDVSGVYLTHGHPELYAEQLSNNWAALSAIQAFASAGGPVYAESGGLMYLSQSVQPEGAAPRRMVGVFPFRTRVTPRLKFGYVEVEVTDQCPLFPRGTRARGHVLHYSETVQERVLSGLTPSPRESASRWGSGYKATVKLGVNKETKIVDEGYSWNRVLASYVQLNFGSNPSLASCLVERCREADVAALTRVAAEAVQVAAASANAPAIAPTPTPPPTPPQAPAAAPPLSVSVPPHGQGLPPGSSVKRQTPTSPLSLEDLSEGSTPGRGSPTEAPSEDRGTAERILVSLGSTTAIEALNGSGAVAGTIAQAQQGQNQGGTPGPTRSSHVPLEMPTSTVGTVADPDCPRTPGGTPTPHGRYSSDIRRVLFSNMAAQAQAQQQQQNGHQQQNGDVIHEEAEAMGSPVSNGAPPASPRPARSPGGPSISPMSPMRPERTRPTGAYQDLGTPSEGLVPFGSVDIGGRVSSEEEASSRANSGGPVVFTPPPTAPFQQHDPLMMSPIRGVTLPRETPSRQSSLSLQLRLAPTTEDMPGTATNGRYGRTPAAPDSPLEPEPDLNPSPGPQWLPPHSPSAALGPTVGHGALAWHRAPPTPTGGAPPLAPSLAFRSPDRSRSPSMDLRALHGPPPPGRPSSQHVRGPSISNLPGEREPSQPLASSWGNASAMSRNSSGFFTGGSRISRSRANLAYLSHEEMIASLGPCATEIIMALGLGERLVAVSEDCSHPPDVRKGREVVARSRQPAGGGGAAPLQSSTSGGAAVGSSAPPGPGLSRLSRPYSTDLFTGSMVMRDGDRIDRERDRERGGDGQRARASRDASHEPGSAKQRRAFPSFDRLFHFGLDSRDRERESSHLPIDLHLWGEDAEAGALSSSAAPTVDVDWFRREGPGLVLVERPAHARALREAHLGLRVVELAPTTLHGTLDCILAVGEAAEAGHVAAPLVEQLRARLRRIAARGAAASPPRSRQRTVLVLKEFSDGRLVAGAKHVPEMVRLAGNATTCPLHPGDPDQAITWDAVRKQAPDVIIFSPASLPSTEHALLEVAQLAARAGWWSLPAVFEGEVYLLSPQAAELVNRPGPRSVEGVDLLSRILRPSAATNGAGGRGRSAAAAHFSAGREGKNLFVLKLDLRGGGRCRPRNLPNYFVYTKLN